jgi:uncharacterized protein (UPF0335 family)
MVNALDLTAQQMIQSYLNRLESLCDEKADIMEAIKDLKAEAKANGLNPKPLVQFLADKKKGWEKVQEEEFLRDEVRRVMGVGPELEDEDDLV